MSASDNPKKNSGGHVDLGERGTDKNGDSISLDRRLFMKFTAFGACIDPIPAIKALENLGADGALYLDVNDPQGIGILIMSEDPDYFVTSLRKTLNEPPFSNMCCKSEFEMLGRTYSIGYETDLVETLFARPQQRITNPDLHWAVWYPLRRAKNFETLSVSHKRRILAEHGTLGKRFGSAGLASDIRLACHALHKNDNDFIEPHNPTILTTPMGENSEEGKRIWVENNLDISRERVIMAPNPPGKSGWAESDRILIDDFYDTNIIPWKAAGGIPVYHTSAAQTIQMLKELGF